MKTKLFLIIFFPFILLFLHSEIFASTGKYALLIFGGFETTRGERGGYEDEEFVQYEIAPMYKTLRDVYEFDDEDIWVLNLDGSADSSYKAHFDPYDDPGDILHYWSASKSNFSSALSAINSELQNNDINLVFIYISGHRGDGDYTQQYNFNNGTLPDTVFADRVDTYLLANNVNSKT